MKCPVCENELTRKIIGQITVDVCENGCGGIWFDDEEIRKFDEEHETDGKLLLNIRRDSKIKIDSSARRKCPKCENIVMMRHFFSVKREIEVDECPKCGGIWLDAGELSAIREQFSTEAERDEATRKLIQREFEPQLKEMASQSQAKARRAKKFAWALRFLCPSYYIDGDQEWGAF